MVTAGRFVSIVLLVLLVGCETTGATYEPTEIDPDAGADSGACVIADPECAPTLPAHVVDEMDGLCARRWCIDGALVTKPKAAGVSCVYRKTEGDPNSWTIGACDECGSCL